jgi:hypothetical protein
MFGFKFSVFCFKDFDGVFDEVVEAFAEDFLVTS